MSRPAIFLDKDGTLVVDVPYNVDPDRIVLAPGVAQGLPKLRAAGFAFVVISNQSGVARGRFPESALRGVEDRLRALLEGLGVPLEAFYYCPHDPAGVVESFAHVCDCRKPAPGMILQACDELSLDPGRSWMVGDILDDIEAGRRAGCRTALIDNGNETVWHRTPWREPDVIAPDFAEATMRITTWHSHPGSDMSRREVEAR